MPWRPPHERFLSVRGIRLRLYDSAESLSYDDPTTLILLHGMPGQLTNWRYQIERLERRWRIVAYDMRGYGESDKPGRVTFEDYLLDLGGVMGRLGIWPENAVLVGHSFGGMVAQAFARGRNLKGLVLVGSAVRHSGGAAEWIVRHLPAILWQPLLFRPNRFTISFYRRLFFSLKSPPRAFEEFMEDNADYISGLPAHVHRYSEMLRGYNAEPWLGEVKCPTLVVVGRDDRVTPVDQSRRIAELIPNSELVVVDGAGHLILYEKPDLLNSLIENFVGTLR
ncbi:MAG: alpha/beta hydrolase [Candidatus Korarchaeota archaeon]|nr:alpha/beta hydrolase [Candidatus Korarchaeota archaeon]